MFKILNPLKINNLHINDFLIVVLSFQLAFWGFIALSNPIFSNSGLQIQPLRQLICFVYILFIPGILILRMFKLNRLGNIETLLYTIGLSISTLMFTGYLVNIISPLLGYFKPISLIPLTIVISIVVLLLCILCYLIDKDSSNPDYLIIDEILSSKNLFLFFIPVLSVLGSFFVNYYHNNILLLLMLTLIALIPIFIAFDKLFTEEMYPVIIWLMSISIIWHYTLITNYAGVHDGEFYFAKSVINNNFWNMDIYSNYNSVLSVTILTPLIHFICGVDLTWVYKVIFPIFLSFVPLGAYSIFQRYVSNKNSFFAAYILLTTSDFYISLSNISKQLMAVFFFVLFLMVTFNTDISNVKKTLLLIIFSFSLIVSHYGTSYIVMFSLIFVFIFVFLIEHQITNNTSISKLCAMFGRDTKIIWESHKSQTKLSSNFVLLFVSLTLAWYIYVSSSSSFFSIVNLADHIANSLLTEFFNPEYSRGAYMLTTEYSGLRYVNKYLKLGIPFMMAIGFLKELANKKSKFDVFYFGFSIYFLILLFCSVAIPRFAVMGPNRLYVFSLLLLSPLCILGGSLIFSETLQHFRFKSKTDPKFLNIFYVYFILLMLFSTQFIYVLSNEQPISVSIGQEYTEKYGNTENKANFYSNLVMTDDFLSLEWLEKNGCKNKKMYFTGGYTHVGSVLRNAGYFPIDNIYNFKDVESIQKNQYILLMYVNNVEKIGYGTLPNVVLFDYFDMNPFNYFLTTRNKIYTNGDSGLLMS